MRIVRRIRLVLTAFASLALPSAILGERVALATDCAGPVSTCINDDTFWPHAGPSQFVSVGGTETLAPGRFGFGLVTTYLSRPLVLHTFSPGPTGGSGAGTDQYAIDDQVNGNFLWSFGVTNRLELDFVLPVTFGQGGTGVGPITGGSGVNDTAMRDFRFGIAYAILARQRVAPDHQTHPIALTARLEASAPSGDRDQFAGERTAVFIPSFAADYRNGRFFAGIELGARIRPISEIVGARIGSQGTMGLGVGYDILPRELLSAMVEARALPTFAKQHDASVGANGIVSTANNTDVIMPGEWAASLRTAPLAGGDLAFTLGGGGGIPFASDPAPTTPRFRFTLGIRYAPLARDTDGDGVPDSVDKCPQERGSAANDGCAGAPGGDVGPAPAIALHLGDAKDVCTTEPEAVDGFREDDGCPDEDADKDGIPNRYDRCPLEGEDFTGLSDGCPGNKPPEKP